ncbi:dynein-1-beta heavy chain, flagellar inner arm I1 complex [Drosophila grimshawi]|uniref:GH10100 n=1 Tax=Drosophila grimshawi TaxID=7222 RepID=B4JCR2_DROGR|nr:dynein-1-beta heavy chain, flagellar inner arm I1 complex [Drosophila grimshawi]EDW04226.1 GH10100 [Drosophila grimshawi]
MTSSSAVEDERLTDSELSDDEERKVEIKPEEVRPPTPRPTYTDEELNQLVEYIQRMTLLYALTQQDWREEPLDMIRRWLLEVNEPLLSIWYEGNKLSACLGFPTDHVDDISYFLRGEPNEIFTVDGFHDEIHFGSIHSDVDASLMCLLERFYAPIFRNYSDWNPTVRSRFCASLDRLLAFMFAMNAKIGGISSLYVPFVLHQIGGKPIVCDRPLFKNLESIAVYWTTQIRTVLGDRTLMVPHELATVNDEFEFWEYRLEVLQGMNSQLAQFDVQRVFKVLRQWQSVHMTQIGELLEAGQQEQLLAMSNIKFLHLLVEPCAKIDVAATPAAVSQLLPHIIQLMRFIWTHSEHYASSDRITILFRNLSNQIIKYCTEQIDLDIILTGRPRLGIKMCNLSLECCMAYKEHVHRLQQNIGWQLQLGNIFNQIDAFMERLGDLMDICEAMIVFGRLDENEKLERTQFSGTSGEQLEKIAGRVEQQFLVALNQLRCNGSKHLMLNVHRAEWYEKVSSYRRSVQRMEETQQRLIANVFRCVCNVEESLEALNVMLYYSYHATLRKCYLRQVTRVWQLFSEDMDATMRQLLLQQRSQRHQSWLPQHVAHTLGYRINLERLRWLRNRLAQSSSSWLPAVPQTAQVLEKFELLREQFERQMQVSHEQWQQLYATCGPHLGQKLERYLLLRKSWLQCNIDVGILDICQQAEHFERLAFALPVAVRKIYERQEQLRSVYCSVSQLCLDYNRLMLRLTARERKLFRPLIQACDRQLAPGIFKLSFGSVAGDGDTNAGYAQWLEDCVWYVDQLRQVMQIYKRANRQIVRCCERICDTSMLRLNFSGAVEISVFEQQLSSGLNRGNSALRKYYNTIVELMLAVSEEFDDVKDELPREWHQYVNVFDDMLASAFMSCARSSLELLLEALHCEEDMSPAPILVMESDVKEAQIVLLPDMPTIGGVLRGIVDRVQSLVDQFPRLGQKLKLPREQRRPNFARAFRDDAECSELVRRIEAEIAGQQQHIGDYIAHWQQHRALWEMTEEAFTQRLLASAKTAGVFEGGIEHYSSLADDISFVDAIAHVHFVLINQNPIKSTLLDWIEKWQALNIKLLLNHATYLIQSVYRYMSRNEQKVMRVPRTHSESIVAHQLFERLVRAVPLKQMRFTPMLELFVLLHKYRVTIAEQTHQQVLELEPNWLHYLQTLHEADELLENEDEAHKILLAQQADKFKLILKEFHEDFFSKLPKK